MDASQNKSKYLESSQSNMNIKTKADVYIDDVKNFTNKIHNDKQKILDNSFKEVKLLSNDLEKLKLHNEELEIRIQDLIREKDNLEDSSDQLKRSFMNLSKKYNETRDLLHTSHNQNLQLSDVVEKIRQNEKALIAESQKSRRFGSATTFNDLQMSANRTMIENLEKEVKFWQQEAEKLKNIINLQEKSYSHSANDKLLQKKKNKKNHNHLKRCNKVVVRSHSVENSQWHSKETEFAKLKMEKEQMQNLLSNLEIQISAIQNNVVKINSEKERYKGLYLDSKEKLDKSETLMSHLEHQLNEKIKKHTEILSENKNYSENINILIKDNKRAQISGQNLMKELEDEKSQHCLEMKNLQFRLESLIQENQDLGMRSSSLKDKIQTIGSEFTNIELELKNKNHQIKEQTDFIENLKAQLEKFQHENKERCNELNQVNEKVKKYQQDYKNSKRNEELVQHKLDIKTKECNTASTVIKEQEKEICDLKTSFNAQIIKFENHIQSSDQVISSKIKLISSLELKIVNIDKKNTEKDEEIVQLKKEINTRNHEYEVIVNKYEEVQCAKKYLQQHIDNISVSNNNNTREILSLNQTISDLTSILEKLEDENVLQKELVKQQDQQILALNISKSDNEKIIKLKEEEMYKNKHKISQFRNDVEHKKAELESMLDVIQEKDKKISLLQTAINDNENKIKEYAEKWDKFDDSMIHATARASSLENEIESLRNANIRLSRQKDQVLQSLSARNKEMGHLQAKLDNLQGFDQTNAHSSNFDPKRENGGRAFKITEDELLYIPSNMHSTREEPDERNGVIEDFEQENYLIRKPILNVTKTPLSANYDPIAVKCRAHSYDAREPCCVDCM